MNEQRSGVTAVSTLVRLCEWRGLNCYVTGGHTMHELSITEHLLEDCIREARAQNAVRIRVIRL